MGRGSQTQTVSAGSRHDLDSAIQRIRQLGVGARPDLADFKTLCEFSDPHSGISAQVTKAEEIRQHELAIDGVLLFEGTKVGTFQRWCYRDGIDGKYLVVKPSWMQLDQEYQQRGFGTAFHEDLENKCRQAGVDRIEIWANQTGAYSWARRDYNLKPFSFGPFILEDNFIRDHGTIFPEPRLQQQYDLDCAHTIARMVSSRTELVNELLQQNKVKPELIEKLHQQLADPNQRISLSSASAEETRRAAAAIAGKIKKPQQLAEFGVEDPWSQSEQRMHLGKALLLGNEWEGFKFLQALPS